MLTIKIETARRYDVHSIKSISSFIYDCIIAFINCRYSLEHVTLGESEEVTVDGCLLRVEK